MSDFTYLENGQIGAQFQVGIQNPDLRWLGSADIDYQESQTMHVLRLIFSTTLSPIRR